MYNPCIIHLEVSEDMELSKYHMGLTNRSCIPTHKNKKLANLKKSIVSIYQVFCFNEAQMPSLIKCQTLLKKHISVFLTTSFTSVNGSEQIKFKSKN